MHTEIERENKEKQEAFLKQEQEDLVGYVYEADNMSRTFVKGDKLYIVKRRFTQNGAIVVLRTKAGLLVCRGYKCEDQYFFMDDSLRVVLRGKNPDIVGEVIGFERFIA